MLPLRAVGWCAILLLLMSATGGCFHATHHPQSEELDPHFQRGRSLTVTQDFKGAAQEFEMALEDNPRSAAAHFELGWLYDTKLTNYTAAIYHYERHLIYQKYLTNSERALLIKERIRGCEQELANREFLLPNSRNLQRDVDRLNTENQALKKQVQELEQKLAAVPAPLPAQVAAEPARSTSAPGERQVLASAAPSHPRVHIVKSRETISSIAAEYGFSPRAVLAANPQTDPRRLRVGQSLNLP